MVVTIKVSSKISQGIMVVISIVGVPSKIPSGSGITKKCTNTVKWFNSPEVVEVPLSKLTFCNWFSKSSIMPSEDNNRVVTGKSALNTPPSIVDSISISTVAVTGRRNSSPSGKSS